MPTMATAAEYQEIAKIEAVSRAADHLSHPDFTKSVISGRVKLYHSRVVQAAWAEARRGRAQRTPRAWWMPCRSEKRMVRSTTMGTSEVT
jgi:hypothetical protein